MEEIDVLPLDPTRFDPLLEDAAAGSFAAALDQGRSVLGRRTVWHVNSTATGGGVAELLQSVLGYLQGAGIRTRRLVLGGDEEFFTVTKRVHNLLHGEPGDGEPLGPEERSTYEAALKPEAEAVVELVQPDDPVLLHDPQSLGLARDLAARGAHLIWVCHVGADEPNELARQAWNFLRPYLEPAQAVVFSRPQYVWEGLAQEQVAVIPPCIDAFSPKNQDLDRSTGRAILAAAGVVPSGDGPRPRFVRQDGAEGEVRSLARMVETAPVPPGARVVTQISRWDPLKDHLGVLEAFARLPLAETAPHLVLAGPEPDGVADDPEQEETLAELLGHWSRLPDQVRDRAHVACLPMDDVEENAAVVNALQRRSDLIVQKSIAEGFGLTVTEALWKGRPTIASRVGGIQDQVVHGESGVLLDDPEDSSELSGQLARLLSDRPKAEALGRNGRIRVRDHYLAPAHLQRHLRLVERVLTA